MECIFVFYVKKRRKKPVDTGNSTSNAFRDASSKFETVKLHFCITDGISIRSFFFSSHFFFFSREENSTVLVLMQLKQKKC